MVIVKTESGFAIDTSLSSLVSKLGTVLYCFQARSSLEEITFIKINVPVAQLRQIPSLSF